MRAVSCDHLDCAPLPGRMVAAADASVWTVELGTGDRAHTALVFVHGIPTTSYLWRNVQRALAPRHRTFAIDLPPLGVSRVGDGDVSLARHAERLAAWADALELTHFTLVAHDVGGALAHHFAARHRERLAGLVLVDAVAFATTWPVTAVRLLRAPGLGDLAATIGPFGSVLEQQVRRGFAVPDRLLPCTWWRWYSQFAARASRRRFLRFIRAFAPHDVEAALRQHAAASSPLPTLVVWGSDDRFQPLAAGQRLAGLLHAPFSMLPDTGHFAPEEQPHAVAALVDAFVASRSSSSRRSGNP
jgi:pimeloyl-ACP methyl ester carboxylesterase